MSFPVQVLWATDVNGLIQDRTEERLGYTDKAMVAVRKMLLRAIRDVQEGQSPSFSGDRSQWPESREFVVRSDLISDSTDWRQTSEA